MSRPTLHWLLAHLVFLTLLLACFSPVWLGGKLLAPMDIQSQMYLPWRGNITVPTVHNHFASDAITQYIPYRWFAHQSLREDGYVGWNNLNYCGTPQYSNTMTTSFDWTVQLHRWLNFWDAWHLGLFLQFLIAGAGMMVFLRSQGLSPLAGLVGAICYSLNFQFVSWIYHRWALGSFCWMPLVLWALAPLLCVEWNRPRAWRAIPLRTFLAPLLLCVAFFGGTLQHAVFVITAVVCLGLAAVIQSGPYPKAWARSLSVFAVIGLLGVGLAWIMFGPCIASFQVNQEATSRAQGFGYPGGILQPLFNIVVYPFYAFPWPLGAPNTLDLWKFFKTDLFNLPFIGFLPAVLALAAAFSKRVPLAPKLLMAAGYLVPLTPLVAPLYHRIYLVGILGAVWAFCVFLDGVERAEVRLWSRWLTILFGVGSLVWIGVGAVVIAMNASIGTKLSEVIEKTVPAINFNVFPQWYLSRGTAFLESFPPWSAAMMFPWMLALVGCSLLLVFAYGRRLSRSALLVTVAVLATAELTLLASRWVTFSPRESSPVALDPGSPNLYPTSQIIDDLRQAGPGVRLYTDPSIPLSVPFPPNTLSTFSIATLRGYDSIADKMMNGVGAPAVDSPRLDELAVTHALVEHSLTDSRWQFVASDGGQSLYLFSKRRPMYLPEGDVSGNVKVLVSTQNHRTLEIPSGAHTLRVSENWHEGWRYRQLGGEWQVPVGNPDLSMRFSLDTQLSYIVEMEFDPRQGDATALISAGSLIVLVFIMLLTVLSRIKRQMFRF